MSAQTLMAPQVRGNSTVRREGSVSRTTGARVTSRPTVTPSRRRSGPRRPARRSPRVLGPRVGASRHWNSRPAGVQPPTVSMSAIAVGQVGTEHADWQLTDRGLAALMVIGGALLAMALVVIVGTFVAVTGEVPQAGPFGFGR